MAIPPIRPKDETPLPLDRPHGSANETVVLYDGPIVVEEFGTTVELSCTPEPKLRWEIEARPGDNIRPDRNPRKLSLHHAGRDWRSSSPSPWSRLPTRSLDLVSLVWVVVSESRSD
jgi:hypothetical protein